MADKLKNVKPVNSDGTEQNLEKIVLSDEAAATAMANSVLSTNQNIDRQNNNKDEEKDNSELISSIINESQEKQRKRAEIDKLNKLITETEKNIKKEEDKTKELGKELLKKKKLNDNIKNLFLPYAKMAANFMILAIPFLTVFFPFAAFAVLAYFLCGALKSYQGSIEKSYISTSNKINDCSANLRVYKTDLKKLNQEKDDILAEINQTEETNSKYEAIQKQIDELKALQIKANTPVRSPNPAMVTTRTGITKQPAGADMGMEMPMPNSPAPVGKK